MNRRYRKTIITGNWKMNKTPAQTKALIEEMKPLVSHSKWCDVVVCVPFVDIVAAIKATRSSKISVGAQNMHEEAEGAYTGEVSAQMLKELGVKYVILGHSERRAYYGETDETVNKKVHTAIAHGLRPIICVGESLEKREQGVEIECIRQQVKIALKDVEAAAVKRIIVAYEPIWAIGTGKTATAQQANEICEAIRTCIREKYGARVARSVTIQYGGSMNDKNAKEILAQPDVDGGLIGGAALQPKAFASIIQAANQ